MGISIVMIQMEDIPYIVFFCTLLQGYSAGMNWLSLYLLKDYTKTGFVLGFYHLGNMLGPFIGNNFVYLSIAALVLFIASFAYKQERIHTSNVYELANDVHLLHASIILFLLLFMFNGFLPVLSIHLHKLKLSDFEISLYFMSMSIPNLFLSTFSGYLADKFDKRIVNLIGILLNLGCICLYFNKVPIVYSILCLSASYGWLLTTSPSILSPNNERLNIYLWFNAMIGLSYSFTPLLVVVYKAYNMSGVATVYLACTVICILIHLLYWNIVAIRQSKIDLCYLFIVSIFESLSHRPVETDLRVKGSLFNLRRYSCKTAKYKRSKIVKWKPDRLYSF